MCLPKGEENVIEKVVLTLKEEVETKEKVAGREEKVDARLPSAIKQTVAKRGKKSLKKYIASEEKN